MEDDTIFGIIQQTLAILEKKVGLVKSTLDVVASHSFKPISEFFKEKQEVYYRQHFIRSRINETFKSMVSL